MLQRPKSFCKGDLTATKYFGVGNVHDDGRRSSGDIRNQMGMYPETPETFQELPPDAQAAVLQQIVDHQQRQSILQAQAHQGD